MEEEKRFKIVHENMGQSGYYYILLHPNCKKDMAEVSQIISEICKSEDLAPQSIILDCTQLKHASNLTKLNLSEVLKLGHRPPGLRRFCIVSTSLLVETFAKGIIKLKKAKDYTHLCSTVEQALALLVTF